MMSEKLLDLLRAINIPNCPLAFSGGLDSAILASLSGCSLYAIGMEDSYDIQNADSVASLLGREVTKVTVTEEEVNSTIPEVEALIGKDNLDLQIAVPFYLLMSNISDPNLVMGQGADELFGGYKRYEGLLDTPELEAALNKDAKELDSILARREMKIAKEFNITPHFPYLNPAIREFAAELPVEQKVSSAGRKLILREVAKSLNLPKEIYDQPKKAIQYGTGISKLVKKYLK